jgi:TonB family protein
MAERSQLTVGWGSRAIAGTDFGTDPDPRCGIPENISALQLPKSFFPQKSPARTGSGSLTIVAMPTSGNIGAKMSRDWKQWEGQMVNGSFPLRQYLGGSDHSAVYLTERRGRDPQKAAIKLIAVDPANAAAQLTRWEFTAKLAHPHLLRLFETGSCQLDNVVLLYVVMEYAEENLAQILPQRALTPPEARELLEPALDALAYIHGKSLAHGRLKPSNILAAQDQLKLSSDSLVRTDDPTTGSLRKIVGNPSPYDAPEVASGKISSASDSWSLGMTLMEALTQRLPALDGMAEPLPETVPAPFMGIAHCCLRRDPQRRCSAADIAARLRSPSLSPMSKVMSKAQGPSTVRIPASSAKWRYILPIVAIVLVAAVVLIGPKMFQHTDSQPATISPQHAPDNSLSSGQQASQVAQPGTDAPAKLEKAPAKPSARRPDNSLQNSAAVGAPEPATPANDTPVATSEQGLVVQQIMPSVSKSARDTIHGTIKVRVKVEADASGSVTSASLVNPGPSKYFARQALQAAQQWKFVPGQDPRTWIVRFGFKRSGTEATVETSNL